MKGMELARKYYEEYGAPMIKKQFGSYEKYLAIGLVGEGSECYGYDDEISRDHDFGPKFCIWLPQEIDEIIGEKLNRAYQSLPRTYQGYTRNETAEGTRRVGVHSIEGFYRRYTGCTGIPQNNREWFKIPESFLSTATNGEIFIDSLGTFSQIRKGLQGFYPKDVVKKKLASRVAVMAQSGQYNYLRAMKRKDYEAGYMACSEFVQSTLGAVYLLNQRYMPFYKWAFRMAKELPQLKNITQKLIDLTILNDWEQGKEKIHKMEEISSDLAKELRIQGFSKTKDDFLYEHSVEIMESIGDNQLRRLHPLVDSR